MQKHESGSVLGRCGSVQAENRPQWIQMAFQTFWIGSGPLLDPRLDHFRDHFWIHFWIASGITFGVMLINFGSILDAFWSNFGDFLVISWKCEDGALARVSARLGRLGRVQKSHIFDVSSRYRFWTCFCAYFFSFCWFLDPQGSPLGSKIAPKWPQKIEN